jgi:hypothetical protein
MRDDEWDSFVKWEDREEDRLRELDEAWEYRLTEPSPKEDGGEKDA